MVFDYNFQLQQKNANQRATRFLAERQFGLMTPFLTGDKQTRILDIGPGAGLTLARLASEGYAFAEGVEGDSTIAAQARAAGLNVRYVPRETVIAHIADLPEQYDLIVCIHVIEHMPVDAQLDFVRACAKALRPGGHFLCETPNALCIAALHHRYGDWTHRSLFTTASLSLLLRSANMDAGGAGNAVPPLGNPVMTVFQRLDPPLLLEIGFVVHFCAPKLNSPNQGLESSWVQ